MPDPTPSQLDAVEDLLEAAYAALVHARERLAAGNRDSAAASLTDVQLLAAAILAELAGPDAVVQVPARGA